MCVQAKKVSDFPTNVFTFSGARALIPFQTIFVASSNFTVLCLIMIVLRRGFYYLCLKILRTFWVQWNDTEVNYFWISANSSWGSSKSHFALNFRSLYFWACQLLLVTECSIIGDGWWESMYFTEQLLVILLSDRAWNYHEKQTNRICSIPD